MDRIKDLFQRKKSGILSVYFTAGFPELNDTAKIIKHLDEAGADMIEIGFPFSDPLADGPVIQQSSTEAIAGGMSLKVLFKSLKNIRFHTQIPLILMGYLNPVLQFGEKKFLDKCKEVGIDGLIIPDMPLDYFENKLQTEFSRRGISNIMLITPNTAPERVLQIDELSSGFIYMVSSNSITGGNNPISRQKAYFERIKTMNLKNPALIGFGVSNNETFNTVCKYANGAIIGSAFIRHLRAHGADKESILQFINSIKN
jgi:tryptophan synthase alpha chain